MMQIALLLERDGQLLVRRRPLAGMLGGLWEFPTAPAAAGQPPEAVAARLLRETGGGELRFIGGVDHAYSHFRLDLRLFAAKAGAADLVAEAGESLWLSTTELAGFPLHGAHKKALTLL